MSNDSLPPRLPTFIFYTIPSSAVLIKLQSTSEFPPGRIVKAQTSETYPEILIHLVLGDNQEFCVFYKLIRMLPVLQSNFERRCSSGLLRTCAQQTNGTTTTLKFVRNAESWTPLQMLCSNNHEGKTHTHTEKSVITQEYTVKTLQVSRICAQFACFQFRFLLSNTLLECSWQFIKLAIILVAPPNKRWSPFSHFFNQGWLCNWFGSIECAGIDTVTMTNQGLKKPQFLLLLFQKLQLLRP